MDSAQEKELFETLGYIKGTVEGVKERLDHHIDAQEKRDTRQDGRLKQCEDTQFDLSGDIKYTKGKIAGISAAVALVISLIQPACQFLGDKYYENQITKSAVTSATNSIPRYPTRTGATPGGEPAGRKESQTTGSGKGSDHRGTTTTTGGT